MKWSAVVGYSSIFGSVLAQLSLVVKTDLGKSRQSHPSTADVV
jgi:hypothetical protein